MSAVRIHGILLIFACAFHGVAQDQRQPVPESAAQKETEKLIKDIFKAEYSKKSPADRIALAKKLLGQGLETKDDLTSRYVVLREARDLAAEAGALDVAFQAIEEMAKSHAIDSAAAKESVLSAASKVLKSPEELRTVARTYLDVAGSWIEADEYDKADKAVSQAQAAAKRAQDLNLVTACTVRAKETKELKEKYDKVRRARETLKTQPDDPAANYHVGQFQCFMKGDWEKGIPLLAKGSDASLKSLAESELADSKDPSEQMRIGDAWWDLAAKENGAPKRNLREHSLGLYKKSLQRLTGLSRTKVEKRVKELLDEKIFKGTWVDITDPGLFGKSGSKGDPIELSAAPGTAESAHLKSLPSGQFDGLSGRIRFPKGRAAVAALQHGSDWRGPVIDARVNSLRVAHHDGKWVYDYTGKVPVREEYTLTVLIQNGTYFVYLDGEETARLPAATELVTAVILYIDGGPVQFDQLKLRKRD